ncbi:hypothetical protein [Ruminococcus sp.]|uniref:hypothetical protein n=1 Tax=Ruminococcus sp. TaxID=41978 RepID=UPI0025D84F58|nr:hypothetical protein [Ruminococcus sp.]MBR1430059.1 hypothetical protein [Ruminococcus sp.]
MDEKKTIYELSQLETELEETKEKLRFEEEKYERSQPIQPTRQIAQKIPYPRLVPHAKFDKNYLIIISALGIGILLGAFLLGINNKTISSFGSVLSMLCFIGEIPIITIMFIKFSDDKAKDLIAQKNSPEVINKCKEIDKINVDNQKKLDDEYNNKLLPHYNAEKERIDLEWSNLKSSLKNDIATISDKLDEIYSSSKIIPKQYRDATILKEIYDIMDSADYSVKEAIETFDRNRQLQLDAARLQAQNQANEVAAQQNELLAENNSIAERARREANIANFVGAVQRHNTNKSLKNINKKL